MIEPKSLTINLQRNEPEKPQLSVMEQMIEDKIIDNADALLDSLSDHKLQPSKHNDFHFTLWFKSIFNTHLLGDETKYEASTEILLVHIMKNPSVLNSKMIQCQIPGLLEQYAEGNEDSALGNMLINTEDNYQE